MMARIDVSNATASDNPVMARIELGDATITALPPETLRATCDPGPIVAALARVPALLGPTLEFLETAVRAGVASSRHKRIAMLRTSVLQGSPHGINAHTAAGLDAGLTIDELRALRGEAPLESVFADDGESVLIQWIDAIAGATGPVLDDVDAAVRGHWPIGELIDLCVTIGATMLLDRFAAAFELPTSAELAVRLEVLGLA